MMTFYFICLLIGLVFSVLSFIFSGGFEASVDADVGTGLDVDADGDIAGGDAGVGDVHFPLFSPVVIATFVAAFGAGGIIGMKVFAMVPAMSLLVAMGFGLGIGLLAGFVVMKIYKHLQSNAITTAQSLVGSLAEVIEPIPAESVGEILFSGKSQRMSGPARSEEKKDIKRHAMVTITKVVGGLYIVREHIDEKLRDAQAEESKPEKETNTNPMV
ncbi:MAG: hypothetical protein JRF33_01845 [Deltaproteobacteria bacterium]|nr:hypothetical protein [Deltaproteobacteria bacterium]